MGLTYTRGRRDHPPGFRVAALRGGRATHAGMKPFAPWLPGFFAFVSIIARHQYQISPRCPAPLPYSRLASENRPTECGRSTPSPTEMKLLLAVSTLALAAQQVFPPPQDVLPPEEAPLKEAPLPWEVPPMDEEPQIEDKPPMEELSPTKAPQPPEALPPEEEPPMDVPPLEEAHSPPEAPPPPPAPPSYCYNPCPEPNLEPYCCRKVNHTPDGKLRAKKCRACSFPPTPAPPSP